MTVGFGSIEIISQKLSPPFWAVVFCPCPVNERPGVHTELSGDRAGVLSCVSVTRDRRLSKASPDPSKEGSADVRQP